MITYDITLVIAFHHHKNKKVAGLHDHESFRDLTDYAVIISIIIGISKQEEYCDCWY